MNIRNGTLLLVAASVVAIFASACSKKSSSTGGGGNTVAVGAYVLGGEAVGSTNGCQVSVTSDNGKSRNVTGVTANTITIDTGNVFTLNAGSTTEYTAPVDNQPLDWTSTSGQNYPSYEKNGTFNATYHCVEADLYNESLTVTGKNAFTITIQTQYTVQSGTAAQCILGENSAFGLSLTQFPCESIVTVNATL